MSFVLEIESRKQIKMQGHLKDWWMTAITNEQKILVGKAVFREDNSDTIIDFIAEKGVPSFKKKENKYSFP